MRSDEVVVAAEELEVLFELVLRARVGKRSSQQVGRTLPDGQIQTLDGGRVQSRGVLGVVETRRLTLVQPEKRQGDRRIDVRDRLLFPGEGAAGSSSCA